MASLPFHGVSVFLHIRDSGEFGTDRTRHYAKKAIRKIGAVLTLSEAAADIVVFHCGSTSLLENLTAHGKIVVSPLYLTECANRMERLPVDSFRIYAPITGGEKENEKDKEKGKDLRKAEKPQKASGALSAAHTQRGTSAEISQTFVLTASPPSTTFPFSAATSSVNRKTFAMSAKEAAGEAVVLGETDETQFCEKTSAPRLLEDESDETPPIKKRDEEETKTSGDMSQRKRPYLLDDDDDDDHNDNNNNINNDDETYAISVPVVAPIHEEAKKSGAAVNFTAPQNICDAAPNRRKRFRRDANASDSVNVNSRAERERQRQREEGEKGESANVCLSPAPLRIAVAGADAETVHFFFDVIEQLGAAVAPRVFGRGRKPTHLVMAGPHKEPNNEKDKDKDKSGEKDRAAALMAVALGIPVLAERWLRDAIALGAFPPVGAAHAHPIYGKFCDLSALPGERQRGERERGEADIWRRAGQPRARVGDALAHIMNADIGPHYRPIFVGMTFAFCRRPSMHAAAEHFAEILRLLGATVSRAGDSAQLTARIDFAPETNAKTEAAREGKGPAHADAKKRGARQAKSEKLRNATGMAGEKVPVISVEWVVQCILLGEATEMAPFEVKSDESAISAADKSGEVAIRTDTRSEYTKEEKNKKKEKEKKKSVERPPVASVLAKTREGPKSAKKRAEDQLSTQQLLEE